MPLNRRNQRVFHRTLFAGMNQTVTLLKRGDDLQQGTVTAYTLFQVRRSLISKTGEQIVGGTQSDHRCIWHIPRVEMDRVGVTYINSADRIVDQEGRYWQPEATTEIVDKLLELHLDLQCLRIDPPGSSFVA